MEYELPSKFDLIVVGTGMVESIIAAAASRIGKQVLHIDTNNYYGGTWASFNLDVIRKLNNDSKIPSEKVKQETETETVYPIGNDVFKISVSSQTWYIPETTVENNEGPSDSGFVDQIEWTCEKLLKDSRKFNIDLAPKLHFARGDFVELLISSNIARYSEFRSVSRVLTWLNNQLEVVPCSRSDVFSSTKVSIIEKRMLMKLLNLCVDGNENEFAGYENKTFRTFLKDRKLTDNLVHYVLYAIAMCTDTTSCLEGAENTKRFLSSLGRFGKTPFLFSMYGSGEITQAFCRLSAVFGGTYALNQPLNGIVFDKENNFKSLLCGTQRISAEHLLLGIEYLPKEFINFETSERLSRAVFITNKSILESEKEHLTLLLFPPMNGKNPCVIIELGSLTGTCPKNLFLVHMFTKQSINPEEDLKHCVQHLFGTHSDSEKTNIVKVLWSFYYTVQDTSNIDLTNKAYPNVFTCPGSDTDLDYDSVIKKAKLIFNEIYPESEFLPRAPDPEEIIIEDESESNNDGESHGLINEPETIAAVVDVDNITQRD